jgi:hypothetical protein
MIIGVLEQPKQPAETFALGANFGASEHGPGWLEPGETILNMSASAINAGTGANSTGTILSGNGSIAANKLGQPATRASIRCFGGTSGDSHTVQIQVTTSLGNVYEVEIGVPILET